MSEREGSKSVTQWQLLLIAVMFYTRLPVPKSLPHSVTALNQSRVYLPAVGLIIGSIGAIIFSLFLVLLPLTLAVALSIASTILATGAFHEDGFADSCDGLGGGYTKEQVLSIMKDSRIGSYACVGLLIILSIKFLALWEIATVSPLLLCLMLVLAHTMSRLLASSVIDFYDYVQDTDKSKVKAITDTQLQPAQWRISVATAMLPAIAIIIYQPQLLMSLVLALVAGVIVAWRFADYCQSRIGGYTGDILGAIQQLTEITIYLIFLMGL